MSFCVALLLGLAVATVSVLYGGLYEPVFNLPSCLLLMVMGGFLAGGVLSGRFKPRFGGAQIALLLLAAYLIWRAAVISPSAGFSMAGSLAALALIYLSGGWLAETVGARWLCIGLILAAAFGQILAGIPQMLGNDPFWPLPWLSEQLRGWYGGRGGGRLHGFYLNANHLAWFLNFSGLLALALAFWSRIRVGWKVVLMASALAFFFGSFQTVSRGGLLALGSGLLALLVISTWVILFQVGRLRWPLLAITTGLAVALFFLLQAGLRQVPEYAVRFSSAENDGDYRQNIWPAAWRQFQTEPVWGTGTDTFKYYGRMYRGDRLNTDPLFAHNDWLQFLAEQGALGVLLLLAALAAHFGDFWRGLRRLAIEAQFREGLPQNTALAFKIGAFAFLIAAIVQSIFDFNMHLPANLYLAALCLGWIAEPGNPQPLANPPEKTGLIQPIGAALAIVALMAILTVNLAFTAPFAIRKLQAENALNRALLPDAILLARKTTQLQPTSAVAWSLLGRAEQLQAKAAFFPEDRRRASQTAVDAFYRAVHLEPFEEFHQLCLADALLQLGLINRSWVASVRGISLAPLLSSPYQSAARVAGMGGNDSISNRFATIGIRLPKPRGFAPEASEK